MSIYWRNGWAHGKLKRVKISPRPLRRSFNTKDAEVAQLRHDTWVKELDTPPGETTTHTVREAIDKFTDEHMPTLRPKAIRRYMVSAKWLLAYFVDLKLTEVTSKVLYEFEKWRRKMRHRGRRIAPVTIKRDLALLSSVFSEAETWEWIRYNPVKAYIRGRNSKGALMEGEPRQRYLSHEEEELLFVTAPHAIDNELDLNTLIDAMAFAIDTGLRAEEQWSLSRESFNYARRRVFVPGDVAKSHRSRWVPLLPRSAEIAERRRMSNIADHTFWRYDGERVEHTWLYRLFQKVVEAAGLTNLEWHDLRRTCGCRLLQDHKMSMERVSRWLGHSSVKVTEKHYAFLRVEDLEDALKTGVA